MVAPCQRISSQRGPDFTDKYVEGVRLIGGPHNRGFTVYNFHIPYHDLKLILSFNTIYIQQRNSSFATR